MLLGAKQSPSLDVQASQTQVVAHWFLLPFLLLLLARVYSFGVVGDLSAEASNVKTAILGLSYFMALLLLLNKMETASLLFNKLAPLFILSIYACLTAGWSIAPGIVIFRAAHIVGLGFVAISTGLWIRGRTESFFPILMLAMFGAVALSLFYVFFVPMRGLINPEWGPKISRWTGVTQHPNFLGMVGVVSFWAALSYLSQKTSFILRLIAWCSLPLTLVVLQGSGSRTAIVTAIVLAASAFLMRGTASLSFSMLAKRLGLAFVGTLVTVTLLFAAAPDLAKRILMPEARTGAADTLSGRPEIWARGVEAFIENPFGWTFDDLTTYWSQTTFTERYLHFHNGFLDIAVKGGLIAEILLLAMLTLMFRCAFKLRVYDPLFAKSFLSYLICNLIYNMTESGFDRETLLWPLMVVMWGCSESLLLVHKGTAKPVCCLGQRSEN